MLALVPKHATQTTGGVALTPKSRKSIPEEIHTGSEAFLLVGDVAIGVGDEAEHSRLVTQETIDSFAIVSGDENPIHVNPNFAAELGLPGCIAHGVFTLSLVSSVLGNTLPGHGAILVGFREIEFLGPVVAGSTVKTRVRVVGITKQGKRVFTEFECSVGSKVVLKGAAELKLPK